MSKEQHNSKDRSETRQHIEDENVDTFDDLQEAAQESEDQVDEANDMINHELADIDALNKQLLDAQAQVEKEKKEYLFLMAEFDNFRKRTLREKGELIKNASESVLKGLLPIVDDFERGLEACSKADDPAEIRKGMELIYQKLVKFLAQNGVTAIEATGPPFAAEFHEAIAMVPVGDESQKGIVIDTPTKGYTLNDKVLRHAKVAVGQ
ncbi:MAG: nucleotide exchange factor GrpE [Duncaniella sp.]|nr:nucleotide exchange factor GrpE [Duncaniella sp.]